MGRWTSLSVGAKASYPRRAVSEPVSVGPALTAVLKSRQRKRGNGGQQTRSVACHRGVAGHSPGGVKHLPSMTNHDQAVDDTDFMLLSDSLTVT
jgi:hypothetical protein